MKIRRLGVRSTFSVRASRNSLSVSDTGHTEKQFKSLTPVVRVLPVHFKFTPLLSSQIFHFLGPPADIEKEIQNLLDIRQEEGILERPTIIWEPAPPSCTQKNLSACVRAA